MNEQRHDKRSLGVLDMALFTVSAIPLLDTLTAPASIGVSSIAKFGFGPNCFPGLLPHEKTGSSGALIVLFYMVPAPRFERGTY